MLPCNASLKWGSGSLGSGKRHKSVPFSQRSINICKCFAYVRITNCKKSKKKMYAFSIMGVGNIFPFREVPALSMKLSR